MRDTIMEKLAQLERQEGIRILCAVESGSRAWGFPSPDSDYDVRFLYVRPLEEYLRLNPPRDVLEWPIDNLMDFSGWDWPKALRLLHGSNPTLFEWCSSPIVYRSSAEFEALKAVLPDYFLCKPGLHHYLHMSEGNYREYLRGPVVRAKKYFYVLRPLLACRWILRHATPPPMAFDTLAYECLEPALRPAVDDLLARKRNTPEVGELPRIDALNAYIERSLMELTEAANGLPPSPRTGWERLDGLFHLALRLP